MTRPSIIFLALVAFSAQAQDFGPSVTTAQQTLTDMWTVLQQTRALLATAQQQSAADTATILNLRNQVAALQAQLAGVPACPPVVICPVCPAPVVCPAPPPPPVVTPPPPLPTGVAALAWDAVAGATGYRVYYGALSGKYLQPLGQGIQTLATTFTVSGLTSGIRYFFAVTALNAQGESGFSNEVFKDIGVIPPPIVIPPPVVTPPPPPPPPPTGASADCTKMPPATQIIAGDGAKFTLVPVTGAQPRVLRNGVIVTSALSDFVTIKAGTVCQLDDGAWECWLGKWVVSSAVTCP